jgi:WD40 repeat protein
MNWHRTSQFTGHRGAVYALDGQGDDHRFLSGSGDGRVVRWDLRSPDAGELVADAVHAVFSLYHDAARKILIIGNENGGLHVIDLVEREEIRLLQAHQKGIFNIRSLPGERLACAAGDGSLSIWQLPSMELIRRIPLCEEKVRGMDVDATGEWLAVACGDGSVRVLDTTDLNEHHTIEAHAKGAASVTWHPRKPVLISGGRDGFLRFWRSDDRFRPLHAIPAHRANIYGIRFDADATICATASRDKTVKLWDGSTFDVQAKLDLKAGGHTHSVNAVRWCADGTLLSCGDDKRIIRWAQGDQSG